MPINRYEIRNEYSLADPGLYRAADKDDPEALLEGVAMAGLVGVLRQLGDLAEFAAEIFHDLHEQVIATSARGHSLTVRVQQLDAEISSIEKAFLSQTDHSSFFYSAGIDWHPNLRIEQNLVTQGDLPRFVMDSYEECRGPPRLFLLDKFDVAGAGACLKRYSDPSFFKLETFAMANPDVQREKKIRKVKKKLPRGRYGETPELLLSSHAKHHHLFLGEPDENSVIKPVHRAKLKRRSNGFLVDSKTGMSYMENLLETPSPEHKMLHEITESLPLRMSTKDLTESDLDTLELRSVSPARESEGRKINPPPPDREDSPFMNQTNDESTDIKICEVPSYLNFVKEAVQSTFDEENGEKDIILYGESKEEGNLTGYQSDEVASEIDNYMDAPSTMESEMDTDSEMRVTNYYTSSYVESRSSIPVENGENLQSQPSDSQSTGDFAISDEGSNSCIKVSSFLSSVSSRTSAENPQSEKLAAEGCPSADIHEIDLIDASSYQRTADEKISEPVVSEDTFHGEDALPNKPDQQLNSDLYSSNSLLILPHYDSRGVVRTGCLMGPKSDKKASTYEDEEKKTILVIDTLYSCSVSHSKSLSGDDSPRSFSGEMRVDGENAPCTSNNIDIFGHTSNSPAAISNYLLHEDDNGLEDLNQFENMKSTLTMVAVVTQNWIVNEEIISNESKTQGKLDNQVTELRDNFASNSTDIVQIGADITLKVPEGEKDNDNMYREDRTVVSDEPSRFSCIMEAPTGKDLRETSSTNGENGDSEHRYSSSLIVNQIDSETLISFGMEGSPYLLEAGLGSHDTGFIHEEATTVNEIGTPQGSGITNDVSQYDPEDPERTADTAEKDETNPDSGVDGLNHTDINSSSALKLPNEVHVLLDESDPKIHQSGSQQISCSVLAASDNTIRENVCLPPGLDKLVEEHIPCFDDSGLGEHEIAKTSLFASNRELELVEDNKIDLSGCNGQSGLLEEVDERQGATLDYHTVSCSTENNDQPKSKAEVPHTVFHSYYDSEVEHRLDFVNATNIQPPLESFQQIVVENQVSDVKSKPIGCVAEETMLKEKNESPPDRIDQELLDSGEKSSELSSLLPMTHQIILYQENYKRHNNFTSPVYCPPSVSGLSGELGLRSYGGDVSAYPKDPSGFIFPPSNLFSETNQMNLDELPPLPPLPPLQWRMGKLQYALPATEVDEMEHKEFAQETSLPAPSTDCVSSSVELISSQISLKGENVEQSSTLEANSKHETIDLPRKIENEQQQQQQLVMPTQKNDEVTSPDEEDGVANGRRMVKLPRSCNPIIGSAAALDKSKLRKVTERDRTQIQKPDVRDALLEQIKAKSFNLKSAVPSRPTVQGPKTNLNVAAILEKANAIRQALAGSDEDDEDNWSDS